jgi:hypothetical protein
MNNKFLPLRLLVLATVVVITLFMWQGHKGFDLADEGFLWLGAQRVMLGAVPIRDFMAYDPGRYYWSVALMGLWDDNGIISLRVAVGIFQALGLFAGLWLIARTEKKLNLIYIFLSAITLAVWMFPRHKLFDISLSILLIGILTLLIQNPTNRRYFFAGVGVGLVAVFGRNHGIYGVAGSVGVMFWLTIGRAEGAGLIKGFSLWAAGVAAGFTPMLFMLLLVPGFAAAYWESIRFLFEIGATNLSLPVPWPWKANLTAPPGDAIREVLVGFLFVATIVFGVLSVIWAIRQRFQNKPVSPELAAASFLALPYAHYAYSRADVAHLAQGIFPLLVGCLVLIATQSARVKWPLAITLCAASLWTMHAFHPGWQCHIDKQCVNIDVSGSNLLVDAGTASNVGLLRTLARQYTPDGQSFIATPFWPGAYPLLGRNSPLWEIYAVYPRSPAFEQAEIERIKMARPGFAVVIDLPLDGRDELRFRNTHPLVSRFIVDQFERLPDSPNPAIQIYRAKENIH